MRKQQFTAALVFAIALLVIGFGGVFLADKDTTAPQDTNDVVQTETTVQAEETAPNEQPFSYVGVEGTDALTLLQKEAEVKQNSSGLVTSINGREASDADREYWAFYVNGEMASVGPADYVTKDGDVLEWKIETY